MNIFVCIDDTDNIDSIGTGQVADYIKERITDKLALKCSMTTRHQLYIHDDIPYTSHNSSMCFEVLSNETSLIESIKDIAIYTINEFKAEGSDPGLCIAANLTDNHIQHLINFGFETKQEIKTKEMAYTLAKQCEIFLMELGGSGDGVIGAIAGIGLRLSGNDGELKAGLKDLKLGSYAISTLLMREDVQVVIDIINNCPVTDGTIQFQSRGKSILRNHLYTVYVCSSKEKCSISSSCSEERRDAFNETLIPKQIGEQDTANSLCSESQIYVALKKDVVRSMEFRQEMKTGNVYMNDCSEYCSDVDEEQLSDIKNCANCSYRRWTNKSFICLKGIKKVTY